MSLKGEIASFTQPLRYKAESLTTSGLSSLLHEAISLTDVMSFDILMHLLL